MQGAISDENAQRSTPNVQLRNADLSVRVCPVIGDQTSRFVLDRHSDEIELSTLT
jgi:hypothetical protein